MMLLPSAPPPGAGTGTLGLARGWYVAATSAKVGNRPRRLDLAGREFVAWRTRSGVPAVMSRYCPHQGAALELGRVDGETLRCPFHHWRFAADGECVAAPATRRIPAGAAASVLPIWEGLGLVWAWVGSATPQYPPPSFPPMDPGAAAHRRYAFTFTANASARRVLENGFDVPHFAVVHDIPADLVLDWESAQDHVLAARLTTHDLRVPRPLDRFLRVGQLGLHLSSTPSYQTLTFALDGVPVAHELLALTPVGPGVTIMRGWTVMPRSRTLLGSIATFWGYRWQHRRGTQDDLRIYQHATDVDSTVNTSDDEGVLRFRRFYRRWTAEDPC